MARKTDDRESRGECADYQHGAASDAEASTMKSRAMPAVRTGDGTSADEEAQHDMSIIRGQSAAYSSARCTSIVQFKSCCCIYSRCDQLKKTRLFGRGSAFSRK